LKLDLKVGKKIHAKMLKTEANLRLVETGEALPPGETRYIGTGYLDMLRDPDLISNCVLVRSH
jgi:hypothetical protein